jgi:hypothetical protein
MQAPPHNPHRLGQLGQGGAIEPLNPEDLQRRMQSFVDVNSRGRAILRIPFYAQLVVTMGTDDDLDKCTCGSVQGLHCKFYASLYIIRLRPNGGGGHLAAVKQSFMDSPQDQPIRCVQDGSVWAMTMLDIVTL